MEAKQRALPPGICISAGLYFFDIELYAVALRPPLPLLARSTIRPCAKLRAASTRSSTALPQVSSLLVLANLRISILSVTWLPEASVTSFLPLPVSILRYNGLPGVGAILVENLGHRAKLFAQRLNGSSVIFRWYKFKGRIPVGMVEPFQFSSSVRYIRENRGGVEEERFHRAEWEA